MKRKYLALFLLGVLPTALHADFSYKETTQITGGALVAMMKMAGTFSKQARQAGEPVVSTVTVQGNRMVRSNAMRTEIVDLDNETITTIDHTRKQYTTMTFEQMRQQIDAAIKKSKEQQGTDSQAVASRPICLFRSRFVTPARPKRLPGLRQQNRF